MSIEAAMAGCLIEISDQAPEILAFSLHFASAIDDREKTATVSRRPAYQKVKVSVSGVAKMRHPKKGTYSPAKQILLHRVGISMNAFEDGEVCAVTSSLALEQDVAWMMAFQAGDRASFGRIVEEYRRPVISHVYRLVRDVSIAEELSQEVFLRVYRTRDYRPTAKLRSWLFRIATNLALNWLRDHRHEACHQRLDHPLAQTRLREPQAPTPNMEEFLLRDVRLAEVRAAIQELPPNHRAAVLMHKYQELDYAEMARAMNCSIPAIKSLLFRAYENLRKRLAHLDPVTQSHGA